jgi:2-dehydro-3-deoxyphosphogluconate aldolase/(4S)-4-hydroxy-2-oxoglutarate aldolase
MTTPDIIDALRGSIVAIVRANSFAGAVSRMELAREMGFAAIEITMTTPSAIDLIKVATTQFPLVGVGTVRTEDQLVQAAYAGARVAFSPGNPDFLIPAAQKHGVLAIPGVATPGELQAALDQGSQVCKVFPAERLGGPPFIGDLLGPFPDARIIATGGVTLASAGDYLSAGAFAVGVTRFE